MAVTKAGKQLFKLDTQVIVPISSDITHLKKNAFRESDGEQQATVSLPLLTSHFQSQICENLRTFYQKYVW